MACNYEFDKRLLIYRANFNVPWNGIALDSEIKCFPLWDAAYRIPELVKLPWAIGLNERIAGTLNLHRGIPRDPVLGARPRLRGLVGRNGKRRGISVDFGRPKLLAVSKHSVGAPDNKHQGQQKEVLFHA